MADKTIKQTAAKGGASAVDMAARPFRCEWHEGCSKSFNRKSDLQRHYRIHTNERPYACDYKPCNKTFIQRSALTVHRRTHTGDKPHKCPFLGCGKCFSDSSSLARHRRIHTNDKPYICRNQRCKKAFCRKTTMTKHIRKEHPTEPIQDDQDAEYSDVDLSEDEGLEEDTEDIKEESRYQELIDTKGSQLTQSLSNYNKDLWRLPSETMQRPTPLQLRSIHHSEISCRDIKLERTSSATSMRSMSSPYSDVPMSSEHPPIRADTIPGNLPIQPTLQQAITHSALPQQYQLRNHDNSVGLWSPQHSIQDSPTSVTNASPSSASTQSHGMFTSQPFQIPPTSLPSNEQMYPLHHNGIVLPIQQPMNDLAVHEIHLDQPQQDQYRDMASAPVHQQQYDGIPQHVAQEQYIDMSRDSSRHHSYSESQPQSAIHQYQGEVPPTPAPTQQLPYALPQQVPYQQPQLISIDNYNNTYYPPNGTPIQYPNNSMDWLEEIKPEDTWGRGDAWGQLPSQRIPGWP